MILLRSIYRLLALFQAHATYQGLSLGICMGMLLGLSSFDTAHFWFFFCLLFLLKINMATALFSSALFWLIGFLGKNAFVLVGDFLLNRKTLISFWNVLYEAPIIPYSNFYVPQVLGKLLVAFLLLVPLYALSMTLIKIMEPHIYHWWRATRLYALYRGYKPYAR